MMTFEEYEQACKECGLTVMESDVWGRSHYDYGYMYEGYKIISIRTPGGKSFSSYNVVKNTPVMAFLPLFDDPLKQTCMIAGDALKNRIYWSMKYVKNFKVQEKIKELDDDFK